MNNPARSGLATAPALRALTGVFGVIWLVNAAFQAEAWLIVPSARANFLHALTKPITKVPDAVRPLLLAIRDGVMFVGPEVIVGIMVVIAILLGLALLTRRMIRPAAFCGIIYSVICWVVLNGFGYPYANGQTDPGVFVAYAIAFLFVLSVAPLLREGHGELHPDDNRLWNLARLCFGALWLFDAALKWVPAFLLHFASQITSVIPGQPQWVAVWLGFIAVIIGAIGPVVVAALVGLSETVIAAGLLSGRFLRLVIPFAMLYSFAVWSTAEAFGGPYSTAGTGVRGNVLGNVLIYLISLGFLWIGESARKNLRASSA